jgi:hypothetical protein
VNYSPISVFLKWKKTGGSMDGLRTFVTESIVLRGMGSWRRRNWAVKSFHTCLTLVKDGLQPEPSMPPILKTTS